MTSLDPYSLFSIGNPEAALRLQSCERTEGLHECLTEAQEPNLQDTRKGALVYVYDQKGAFDSTFCWRQQFSLYKTDLLIVFGVGLGLEWQALIPWLDSDPTKRVIFLEDDLAMLHHVLKQPLSQALLSHPRTHVFYFDEGEIGKRVYDIVGWNSFGQKVQVVSTAYYQVTRPKACKKLEQNLTLKNEEITTPIDELLSFGRLQFRNFFKNISPIQRSRVASQLYQAFRGFPAIVVGAGPSLEKNLPLLYELQDSALIISGGTATNALLESGIHPHFGVAVDPNPTQYSRLKQIQPFMIPLVYQSRVLPEGIKQYAGEMLYLRGGHGQNVLEMFDHILGIKGPIFNGGYGVSNMNVELAHKLGCAPIMMVGYDFSYPEGKLYSSSVQEALTHNEQKSLKEKQVGPIKAIGNTGHDVQTESKWIAEAAWILRYAENHPRMKLFNTSLEGLRIGSVPCVSLEELRKQYMTRTLCMRARVHRAIYQTQSVNFSFDAVFHGLEKLALSAERGLKLIEQMREGNLLAETEWKESRIYRQLVQIYDLMLDKRKEMKKALREIEFMGYEGAFEQFEKVIFEEKLEFFERGLTQFIRSVREWSASSCFDGMFPPFDVHLEKLELPTPLPEFLVENSHV